MHLLIAGNRPYPRKPSQETKDGNFRDLHDRPLTREPYFSVLSTELAPSGMPSLPAYILLQKTHSDTLTVTF